MWELDRDNIVEYLRTTGRLAPDEPATAEQLGWGVSNIVLRVQTPRQRLVIKQARAQLRTRDPWFSRLDRVFREKDVMDVLAGLLPPGTIPEILFEDRPNYLFAMQAAPAEHEVWKARLLRGLDDSDRTVIHHCGQLLGTIHAATYGNQDLADRFDDHEVFWQLRVEPFYLRVAEKHPDVADSLNALIEQMFAHKVALVHADFSPKNMLLHREGLTLVDFETAHWGDPAFDLGFFLSHLILKAIHHAPNHRPFFDLTRTFWESYTQRLGDLAEEGRVAGEQNRDRVAGAKAFRPCPGPGHASLSPGHPLVARSTLHFAGCAWARIDGTSPIDYLPEEPKRQAVRDLCRELLLHPGSDWQAALEHVEDRLRRLQ